MEPKNQNEREGTTETALAVVEKQASLTPAQVKGHITLARETIAGVLEPNIHYGMIPGCGKKNVLFKPGAQVLAVAFRLRPMYNVMRIDLGGGHVEYQVTCDLYHIHSGELVGSGMGSCSTMEAKYRYRNAPRTCPECGKAETIIKGKEEYGGGYLCFAKKGGCGAKFKDGDARIENQPVGKIEYDNPADFYNTVLKQANKRAFIEAVLNTTAAGDAFTQDFDDMAVRARSWLGDGEIEDLPAGSIYDDGVGPPPESGRRVDKAKHEPRKPGKTDREKQIERIYAKAGILNQTYTIVDNMDLDELEEYLDTAIAGGEDVPDDPPPDETETLITEIGAMFKQLSMAKKDQEQYIANVVGAGITKANASLEQLRTLRDALLKETGAGENG